jgi:hypothetical protein
MSARLGTVAAQLPTGARMLAQNWFSRHALLGPPSTNRDTHDLPFQRWYRVKEAFAPRAVMEAFAALPKVPATCIDPFGGSGTTALTAQFLGIRPTTVEVNPFLADLIEAKLQSYDSAALIRSYRKVVDAAAERVDAHALLAGAPPTFLEPGVKGRYVYGTSVAERILAHRQAIDGLEDKSHARLLRVLLGATLITLSNVVISGKGRRYRSGWERRLVDPRSVARLFETAFLDAIEDVVRFGRRPCSDYTLLRGDARRELEAAPPADFALFSPPYPNSFDYTDIYNVELWMLGYLKSAEDNRALREATVRSHVQIKRSFEAGHHTPTLVAALSELEARRGDLWNRSIPEMVAAYFDDLAGILISLYRLMPKGSSVMMVVGDSQYAGVPIDVGKISAELAADLGFDLERLAPMRSMRSSAQQGGDYALGETLVHLITR